MRIHVFFFLVFFSLMSQLSLAQVKDSIRLTDTISKKIKQNKKSVPVGHSPRTATIRSAILPGWGQYYNKKYWKIPLVYGAIGTCAGLFYYNLNEYHEFRDAYKDRLAGNPNPKYAYLDNNRLIQAQRFYQRNRDLSLLLTVAFYALNIIDANVDAHLGQFNVNSNLSLRPEIKPDEQYIRPTFGVAFNYQF